MCVFICMLYIFYMMLWWLVTDAYFLFAALKRSQLSQDGHNRELRALHHREHHYKRFIRLELLAMYPFGPEPNEAVLSLQEINEKNEYLR